MDVCEINAALDKSNDIEKEFLIASAKNNSGLDAILSLQDQISDLYSVLSVLLKKKQSIDDYDALHQVLNKWDSLYSYYNLDFGKIRIVKDKSLSPENIVKKEFSKYIKGVVVKCSMQKTVTVLVQRTVTHHPTGKKLLKSTKYLVHDPYSCCQVGDEVIACEVKPISKRKSHVFFRKIFQ